MRALCRCYSIDDWIFTSRKLGIFLETIGRFRFDLVGRGCVHVRTVSEWWHTALYPVVSVSSIPGQPRLGSELPVESARN